MAENKNEIIKLTEEDESPRMEAADKVENNQESQKPAEVSYDLSKFRLQSILNNNIRNKNITLLGHFPDLSDSDKAIVILEKQAFQESDVTTDTVHNVKSPKEVNDDEAMQEIEQTSEAEKPSYFCDELEVQTEFINNIYGSYQCTPPPKLSSIKATVVYPATDKHIQKYSICEKLLVNETPELYNEITLPHITSSQLSIEWVYNILEHKQESERIIFEDPDPDNGFILLPDLKWDGHNVENLYVLGIVHKRDIKSIRDLDATHLPLLRNMRTSVSEALESRYGILSTQLRMYFHYQPSFYHLHIHVNPVRNEAPGIWCEKSHLLDTVINNLELLPNYYKVATLPFMLFDGSKLMELYEAKMTLRKSIKGLTDEIVNYGVPEAINRKIVEETTDEVESKTTAV